MSSSSNNADSASFIKQTHKVETPLATAAQLQEISAVTLLNGIRVVIIQDPNTTAAYAAASCFVGDHWDPVETPGLAHLTEHMLFLGTKRDPEEGGFDKFLSEHAGMSNAYTEDSTTNYHFSSSTSSFKEALTRFCHFFVEPTLTPTGLEREVQAVHSEDEKNHTSDYWCFQEILKERFCNKDHPHSRYGNGNAATLWDGPRSGGLNLHDFLMKFYQEHYVSENLVVVAYSPLSSKEVLDDVLIPILRNVRSNGLGKRVNAHSFVNPSNGLAIQAIDSSYLGTITHIKSNEHMQRLDIIFPVKNSKQLIDRYKIHYFITWLIGHECVGSIVDVLRKEVLATDVNTNEEQIDDENFLITTSISLTTKGLRLVHKVIEIFFDGIHFLLNHAKTDEKRIEEIFREMIAGDKLQFHVREVPTDTDEFVATLAQNCNSYSPERSISGAELMEEMHKEKILEVLEQVSKSENALYYLWLPEPEDVVKNSENFLKENPDIKIEDHCLAHEDQEADDDGDEDDEEDGEEEEEEDEEWLDIDEEEEEGDDDDDDENKSKTNKLLPIDKMPALRTYLTETSTHHEAKYSLPTKIDDNLLQFWSRARGVQSQDSASSFSSLKQKFMLPKQNPFISDLSSSSDDNDTSRQQDSSSSLLPSPHHYPRPTSVHQSQWGTVLFQRFGHPEDQDQHHQRNNNIINGNTTTTSSGVPKGHIVITIASPSAYQSPKNRFHVGVLSSLLEFALAELIYSAELAAYDVTLSNNWRGLYVEVSGPQQKLLMFVRALMTSIFDDILTFGENSAFEEKYRANAERLLRSYHAAKNVDAYHQATEWYNLYIYKSRIHYEEILDAINDQAPPFSEFTEFVSKALFTQKMRYEVLIVSNTANVDFFNECKEFGPQFLEKEIIKQKLPADVQPCVFPDDFEPAEEIQEALTPEQLLRANSTSTAAKSSPKTVKTTSAKKPSTSKSSSSLSLTAPFSAVISRKSTTTGNDTNSACVLSYHFGVATPLTLALSDVVSSLIESQFYDILRTKETIGYVVMGYCISFEGHRFMRFISQSADKTAVYCFSRTIAFIYAAASQMFMIDDEQEDKDKPQKRRSREETEDKNTNNDHDDCNNSEKLKKLNEKIRSTAKSIAADRRNPAKNINDLGEKIWDIRAHPCGYTVDQDEADILEDESKINVDTVRKFFKEFLFNPKISQPIASLCHGPKDKTNAKEFKNFATPNLKQVCISLPKKAEVVSTTAEKKKKVVEEKNQDEEHHHHHHAHDHDGHDHHDHPKHDHHCHHPHIVRHSTCHEDDAQNNNNNKATEVADLVLDDFAKKTDVSLVCLTTDREKYKKLVAGKK